MPGWDGSGNFILPYSMVQQALSGIKILASVQDTMWATVQGGLENCLTLDGQTKPTTDIDWNGQLIQNLGTPTLSSDVATKGYVDGAALAAEWVVELNAVAYNDVNQFKVVLVDATSTYTAGRRVKITHNSGATISYGTVVSSVFGTDTVVTVAVDGNTSLLSTVTAVSYGLLNYQNPSYLDPRSAVLAILTDTGAVSLGTPLKVTLSELIDTQGEFGVGSLFTATHPGVYRCNGQVRCTPSTADGTATVYIYKNGAEYSRAETYAPYAHGVTTASVDLPVQLDAGDTISMYFSLSGGNAGTVQGHATLPYTFLAITRLA